MNRLTHLLDSTLFRLISVIAQLFLVSAVCAAFYQVIARFILQEPSDWSEGWTRTAMIWLVLLGVVLACRQGAMLKVEMLHSLLKDPWQRRLEHVVMLIMAGFFGLMTWIGVLMTYRVRFQTIPSLGISISWIYAAIPVGMALALLAVIVQWANARNESQEEDLTLL